MWRRIVLVVLLSLVGASVWLLKAGLVVCLDRTPSGATLEQRLVGSWQLTSEFGVDGLATFSADGGATFTTLDGLPGFVTQQHHVAWQLTPEGLRIEKTLERGWVLDGGELELGPEEHRDHYVAVSCTGR